jgi:hypothetical protein
VKFVETHDVPYLARQLSRFSTNGSKFVSIVCWTRMVSTGDTNVYAGSGLLRVIPYVQSRVFVFLCYGSL